VQVVQAWLLELLLRHPVLDACTAASAAAAANPQQQQQQQQQAWPHALQAGGYMFGALPGMMGHQQQQMQKHKRQLKLDVHITGRCACRYLLFFCCCSKGGAPKKVSDTMSKNLNQAQGPTHPPFLSAK
jgi:hypothetical protein